MGMFSSISNAISRSADAITGIADTVDKAVGVSNTYVSNRAIAFKDEDAVTVATASALRQAELKGQLDNNKDASEIFTALMAKLEQG